MVRIFLVVLITIFIGACASSATSAANIHINAAQYLNPDVNGEASPIVVSFFELNSPMAFKNASYFDLTTQPDKVLQASLIDKRRVEVRPGQKQVYQLDLAQGMNYLGVISGYRNIEQAHWRSLVIVPRSAKSLKVVVDLNALSMHVSQNNELENVL